MLLWELFKTFLVIGFVSFGGGYAMIPVIEAEVSRHGWMTTKQFTDVIAVAGMSPYHSLSLFFIFGLPLFALTKLRMHPAYVIILSGMAGVTFYS